MRVRAVAWLLIGVGVLGSWPARGAVGQEVALAARSPRFLFAPSGAEPVEIDASRATVFRHVVSLQVEQPTVGRVLAEIERQTGLTFAYGNDFPTNRPVTLRADSITVVSALAAVLYDAGVDVVLSPGGHVALVKRGAAPPGGSIAGRVTDAKSQTALAGATVVVEGTRHSGTTGSDGRYRIAEVAPGTYTVRARFIGYAPGTASVTVSADQEATADLALEKSVQRLDEVITTGTETPTAVRALPSPISVITSDQIAAQHIQRVDQLFRGDVPGMFAWDQGTSDYASSINVRGGSSLAAVPYVKTYVDGVEVTNPSYVGAVLDPNSIDHVEVIRGPQASTIYGSDALNGVLQIFTKNGGGGNPQLDATLSAGVLQTKWVGSRAVDQQDYTASVAGGGAQLSYSVGGSHVHTGEWVREYFSTDNSLYGSIKGASGRVALELSGRYDHLGQGAPQLPLFEPYAGPPLNFFPVNTDNQVETSTLALTLRYRAGSHWTHAVTVGYDRVLQETETRPRHTNPGDTLAVLYSTPASKPSVRYNTTVTLGGSGLVSSTITAGADYYRYQGLIFQTQGPSLVGSIPTSGLAYMFRYDYHNAGYFTQAQIGLRDRLFATAGLRAENNANFGQDFGLAWAPRVGLAYAAPVGGATVKLRSSWGKAIRPPIQGASLANTTPFSVTLPNPLLGPESQKGWDAGVELYDGNLLSVQATYYHQAADDLIDYVLIDPASNPQVYQWQNVGRVNNRGWEFEASTSPVPGLTLSGTYSITTSTVAAVSSTYTGDLRVGDQLLGIPRHVAGASASYRRGRASVTLGLTHAGSWTNTDYVALYGSFFGGQPFRPSGRDYWMSYPAFNKVRLNLTFDVTRRGTVFVNVKNLTNNYAFEQQNIDAPKGRAVLAGLRWQLGL